MLGRCVIDAPSAEHGADEDVIIIDPSQPVSSVMAVMDGTSNRSILYRSRSQSLDNSKNRFANRGLLYEKFRKGYSKIMSSVPWKSNDRGDSREQLQLQSLNGSPELRKIPEYPLLRYAADDETTNLSAEAITVDDENAAKSKKTTAVDPAVHSAESQHEPKKAVEFKGVMGELRRSSDAVWTMLWNLSFRDANGAGDPDSGSETDVDVLFDRHEQCRYADYELEYAGCPPLADTLSAHSCQSLLSGESLNVTAPTVSGRSMATTVPTASGYSAASGSSPAAVASAALDGGGSMATTAPAMSDDSLTTTIVHSVSHGSLATTVHILRPCTLTPTSSPPLYQEIATTFLAPAPPPPSPTMLLSSSTTTPSSTRIQPPPIQNPPSPWLPERWSLSPPLGNAANFETSTPVTGRSRKQILKIKSSLTQAQIDEINKIYTKPYLITLPPLYLAVVKRNPTIVYLLLKFGATPNYQVSTVIVIIIQVFDFFFLSRRNSFDFFLIIYLLFVNIFVAIFSFSSITLPLTLSFQILLIHTRLYFSTYFFYPIFSS